MYCSSCGNQFPDTYKFCQECGTPSATNDYVSHVGKPARALRRPRDDKKVAGVCAGLARYLGVDVTLVRIVILCFAFWPPALGLIFYVVCWIVMPLDPYLLTAGKPGELAAPAQT